MRADFIKKKKNKENMKTKVKRYNYMTAAH